MLTKRGGNWELRIWTNKGCYSSLGVALSSQDWQVYLMNELTEENLRSLALMATLG